MADPLREALGDATAWLPAARALAGDLARGAARATPLDDVQRVFALLPPDGPAGESLFRLAEALPRTRDRAGRLALLRERLPWLRPAALARAALPVVDLGIRSVAGRFVYAAGIGQALSRAQRHGGTWSFDMLGEGARTAPDGARNLRRYADAVDAVARAGQGTRRYGVSIKLSAIHPRHDAASHALVRDALIGALRPLCRTAAAAGIGLTIDAEEAERVALQLDVFAALAAEPEFLAWDGLGLAVQAYRRDALDTLEEALDSARRRTAAGGGRICVRLVKGAYWDAEVKRAQELGLDAYPVHTDKRMTDLSYVVCAQRLLAHAPLAFPQFATHNPISAACVIALAGRIAAVPGFEFQRLHGMGPGLQHALAKAFPAVPMRVYAPVGERDVLLAYLVRRLLENGASASYLRRAATGDIDGALDEAFAFLAADEGEAPFPPAACIPATHLPEYPMPERRSARGYDLGTIDTLQQFAAAVAGEPRDWRALPLVNGAALAGAERTARSPARRDVAIGTVVDADPAAVEAALAAAHAARATWSGTDAQARAAALERLAGLMEADTARLMALCVWEAGKTLADALADVREAVDFCRYYAQEARRLFAEPLALPGPVGERNLLSLHGRGVFACISPWNFPVAIFTGQVAAALVAGNTVVAKPAEQTPLAAYRIAQLILEAGVPPGAFHLLPGGGEVGAALVKDARVAGVVFTGSNETARSIQRALAEREGAIVPLIAETGGLNAMLADATALPEQVVDAVVASAFRSAGQRCSSLRILYLQDEIADTVIEMLRGAMAALRVGDPADPATDVGPVIDEDAQRMLQAYVEDLRRRATPIAEGAAPAHGCFVAPAAFEVPSIDALPGERFGPVLHVARFALPDLDRVVDAINARGYGLTMGVHTRVDSLAERVRRRAAVGNLYVNRNMIGAVVGVQPFGGEGLSGTGPKAGGPHYLLRFATERVFTVNTAAAGGDLRFLTGRALS